jgi:plasmid stabilization system protein ParE
MATQSVEFHPEAVAEARSAREWYEARSQAAANAFIAEIENAIEQISKAPVHWPSYLQGTRRYLLHRFPYSVIYREHESRIQVVAVAHARRKPGYWRER